MPKPHRPNGKQRDALAGELLNFYDDLTALNATTTFVLGALAAAVEGEAPPQRRAASGAVFCVGWLNDRAQELERRLREIRVRAGAGRQRGRGSSGRHR